MLGVFCPNCGHRNPAGVNFCSSCGASLVTSVPDTSVSTCNPIDDERRRTSTSPDRAARAPAGGPDARGQTGLGRGRPVRARIADRDQAGRHPESDIFLDDMTVSRRHAEFVTSDQITTVRDVGSLNGTYVNRERIEEVRLSQRRRGPDREVQARCTWWRPANERCSTGGARRRSEGPVSARSYMSIGDVLTLLRQEFPDVTISKIRFLESQGLVNPERTPSGYRKFYEHDVERLRWVLRQQREHFLPLKVIKDRLDDDAAVPGRCRGRPRRPWPRRRPTKVRNPRAPCDGQADRRGARCWSGSVPVSAGNASATSASGRRRSRGIECDRLLHGIRRHRSSGRAQSQPSGCRNATAQWQTVAGVHRRAPRRGAGPSRTARPGSGPHVGRQLPVASAAATRVRRAATAHPAPSRRGAATDGRGHRAAAGRVTASSATAPSKPRRPGGSAPRRRRRRAFRSRSSSAACGLDEAVLRELAGVRTVDRAPVAGLENFDEEALAVAHGGSRVGPVRGRAPPSAPLQERRRPGGRDSWSRSCCRWSGSGIPRPGRGPTRPPRSWPRLGQQLRSSLLAQRPRESCSTG